MSDNKPWEDFADQQDTGIESDKPWEAFGGETQPESNGTVRRAVADTGIDLLKGAVELPQAYVGIGDLVTGGQTGKALERVGYRPKEAIDSLNEMYSPERKAANQAVSDAKGFVPTIGAAIKNPSTIVGTAVESAPSMLGAGGIARGALPLLERAGVSAATAPVLAGAIGEGALSAGQNAEQVRSEDPNGLLTPKESAILAASGAVTGALGYGAGKVANKLGIGDVETMLAQGKLGAAGEQAVAAGADKSLVRKAAEGFATEGVLQELPQSYQEQVAQNLAQGKPWGEGAPEAGAQGMLAGGITGAPAAMLEGGSHGAQADQQQPGTQSNVDTAVPPQTIAPAIAPPGPADTEAEMGAGGGAVEPQGAAVRAAQPPQGDISARPIADVSPVAPTDSGNYPNLPPAVDIASAGQTAIEADRARRTAQGPTPSQQMGIDPNAGPLSAAAAMAVDTGVHQQAQPVVESVPAAGPLTPDAEAFLTDVDAGGTPAFLTKKLRRIAESNGIPIEKWTTPNDVAESLRQRRGPAAAAQQPVEALSDEDLVARLRAQFEAGNRLDSVTFAKATGISTERAGRIRARVLQENEKLTAESALSTKFRSEMAAKRARRLLDNPDGYEAVRADDGQFELKAKPKTEDIFNDAQAPQDQSVPEAGAAPASAQKSVENAAPAEPAGVAPAPSQSVQTADVPSAQTVTAPSQGEASPAVKDSLTVVSTIDAAAHEAATSPHNDLPQPTDAQKEAGNYQKGHVTVHGLDITIENPRGSERSGKREDGSTWSHEMSDHYGYIKRTEGADGEQVDVYVGPKPESQHVFVVDQQNQNDGGFDEHKVMLGFASQIAAVRAYKSNFDKGWKVGKVTAMSIDQFKEWLKGDTSKPVVEESTKAAPVNDKTGSESKKPQSDTQSASTVPEHAELKIEPVDIRAKLKKDRLFYAAFKSEHGANDPHIESGPAAQFLHGWLDAENGGELNYSQVAKPSSDMRPTGFNPVDSYRSGYFSQKLGSPQRVRTLDESPTGSELKDQSTSVEGSPAKTPRGVLAKKAEADKALADYFTPGNIIKSYGGYDRVVSYQTPDANGQWQVRVRAVEKRDDTWVDVPNSHVRAHMTPPSARELKVGPVERAEVPADQSATVKESLTVAEQAATSAEAGSAAKDADRFANNKLFTADKVAAARARMKSKFGQLNAGIDPEMLIDGMTIAGAYIESGVRNFSQYAARMVGDFGDGVKPYLLSFWEGARNYPGLDTKGMTSAEESAQLHADLVKVLPAEEAAALGSEVKKPAKRTKKNGSKGDTTLTQDWGVDSIDGYGDNYERESGNSVKDQYLKDAAKYLGAVADVLQEQGFTAHDDAKGRPQKPVSKNEGGIAGSGEVSLTLRHPEAGMNVYVHIGDTALRGVVPMTPSGITVMYRVSNKDGDTYATKGTNRWSPVDLSAADLAGIIAKEARGNAPELKRQAVEQTDGDRPANREDSGADAERAGAERVQPSKNGRQAAGKAGFADGDLFAVDRGRPAGSAESNGNVDGAGQNAADEQRVSGSGRDSVESSRRADFRNYRIRPGELKREGSWHATAERNIQIVELVKAITAEGRQATPDEKALLTKFTGWGASEIANGLFPAREGQYRDERWKALAERLQAALTQEEYAQAKRTTQYAHYTSEPIIRSVYSALERMGFGGGQVLEPGMGVGLFNGLMPDGMAANSVYTGIEYDTITGNIAALLYPESNMIVGDFTKTKLPRDYFDAAIGNPPFGQIKIQSDPEYRKQGFLLHDYFFAKTIDRVKPGGLLVFVTSAGTMNKASDRARAYLAERADLVGAVRLPQTAFKDNAGTEVVTDVIFLRKRRDGEASAGAAWLGLKEVSTPQGATQINEYFADHPEMVLGRHALTGSMYRANTYTVEPLEGDIEQHFAKAIENLPEGIYRPERGSAGERAVVQRRDYDPKIRKEGGIYVADDGTLMQVDNGSGVPLTTRRGSSGKDLDLKPRDIAWLSGYVGLRDALKQAQYDQLNEGGWESSLAILQQRYDAFVKQFGPILKHSVIEREQADGTVLTTRRFTNDPLLRLDAEGALAYALENITPAGDIEKAPVLLKRTLNKPTTAQITNVRDAMFVSLDQLGHFDLAHVAELAGKTEAETITELGDAIYQQPSGTWTTADEYLSGNVVRKLREAEQAARTDKRYQRNVAALEAVQPRALAPQDITVQMGAGWIPASDVRAFAKEIMGEELDIGYNPATADWHVGDSASDRGVSEWGTDDRRPNQLLDSILNNRQIKITRYDADKKPYTDPEATEKANEVAKKIRAEFRRWIWSDDERTGRLVTFYNEHFNNIAPRQFDGSHLTLPGVSSLFSLRSHQKRAIWRTIQQGDVYYNHAVGAGKTFTMIAAGMEERRLGLVKKPMYVVPNHMLAQFSKEFLELYPAANIMVADEHNFHTHNRRRFIAQAALNDPDAIIITHSAFGKLPMSEEYSTQFLQSQIDEWQTALDDVSDADRITRKQIERRIEQLENRLEKLRNNDAKDKVLNFEELGVDRLYVDEGHEFRKLDYATNQGSVKGIDSSGSQKAMDLYMKVGYLREKHPGRALVMASGTAVTNTMGELYTVQRFFQPDQLAEDNHEAFDAWSTHYGEIVAGLEQNAAGGYETVSRFAKFVNVPELMARVRGFMDILTSDQLGDLVARPDVAEGGRQIVVTQTPDGYKEYQKELETRIKQIRDRKGPPKPGDDIILKVISDGRFSAIDMRFVDPSLPSDPESKLNRVITDMVAAYHETKDWEFHTKNVPDPDRGATMMLFTDIGLGEQSAASRGFDMKEWIRERLVAGGVDPNHIAFMRDNKAHAKKERLFEDMRQGRKRILIGGKDMETGVNAQKRLADLFHLDCPWFPASVEQREGRIIRQGNQNKTIRIRGYATKGSYDSTMWGMNARKARFIEQAMRGDASMRNMEDVSEASQFEMAAALASGDERYLKLAGLKGDVERLSRLYSAHTGEQKSLKSKAISYEHHIRTGERLIADYQAALQKRERIEAGAFKGMVDGQTFDNREEFSNALWAQFKHLGETFTEGERTLGTLGGFEIAYTGKMFLGDNFGASLELDVPGGYGTLLVWPADPDFLPKSAATRAANIVNGLDAKLLAAEDNLRADRDSLEKVQRRIGKSFPELSELMEKNEELQALEAELAAESATEDAPSADAAAATVEVEGEQAKTLDSVAPARASNFKSAAALDAHLRNGTLGPLIGKLIDRGVVVIHPDRASLAGARSGVAGVYREGRIHLMANQLSSQNALSVLLHEAFHGGVQPLIGGAQWSKLQNRLRFIYRQMQSAKNPARADFMAGFNRVNQVIDFRQKEYDAAHARGENPAKPYMLIEKWQVEEFGAYVVEQYAQAPASLKKWVDDLAGAIKAWLLKTFGLQLGQITPAQLHALSAAALRDGSMSRRTGSLASESVPTDAESAAFRADMERALRVPGRIDRMLRIGQTPTVLQHLGMSNLPIMISKDTILKATNGVKHDVDVDDMKRLPELMADPIMVFDSATEKGAFVMLTEVADTSARPVIIAVHANQKQGFVEINRVASVYGKDGAAAFVRKEMAAGRLRYAHTAKSPEWLHSRGLQLPKENTAQGDRHRVISERDLVNKDSGPNGLESVSLEDGVANVGRNHAAMSSLVSRATSELNKTFSAPGKLSWWHKTIGSMYNLAERAPAFKPVFNAAQSFIEDVSYYAADAADHAPKLLPKLETWRDITKSPVSAEDNAAVTKPIFEGTLSWARDESGRPVRIEALEQAAEQMSAEEKADALLRNDNIPSGMLKVWRGLGEERFGKLIDSRFKSQMLKPGVVWTDAELQSIFGLNDSQIALYHEFRAATNRSLDTMARADMLRFVGDDARELRDTVMDAASNTDAAQILIDHLKMLADKNSDRAEQLLANANGIAERAAKVEQLKAEGYAPLSRFGKYSVDVVVDGERQYFGLFETARAANTMAAQMAEEFGADAVTQGTLSEEAYKLFAGITPESLELFGNMLGLDATGDRAQDQAFQEYLRLTKTNRSAMRRLIHRKGIAGFSEDSGRVLASFVYSNARQAAAALHMGDLGNAVNAIPKQQGELKDVAVRLAEYVKNPQEEAQAIRGMLFAQYLGGSVSAAMVNMTQPLAVTFPWLSQYGGARKAAGAIATAAKNIANKGFVYEPDLAQALHHAEEDGVVSPQEVHQLMAQARGNGSLTAGDGTRAGNATALAKNSLARLSLAWGKLFGSAEQLNRRITFIAAYRTAKAQGMADPDAFARKAVKETQFVYSKASKMQWGRGAVGGTLMTFKTYSVAYLELMGRLWSQGEKGSQERKEGRKAVMLMVATMMLLGGAGGVPFEEDAQDLIDGAAQLMGYNFSSKKAKQEFLEDVFGPTLARFIDKGVSGLPGAPLDISGRLSMGNLIPGTGLVRQSNDHTSDILEFMGPAGDFAKRMFSGAGSILGGDVVGGLLELSPSAVRNAAKGADMAATGMYRDSKGYKVLDASLLEAAMKSIGFQPEGVARVQEANALNQRAKGFYNLSAQDIRSLWAQGIFEKDPAKVQQARDAIADFNTKNPDQPMRINIAAVMRRAREMAKSKDERIAATAPKAMRVRMKEDAAQLRAELAD